MSAEGSRLIVSMQQEHSVKTNYYTPETREIRKISKILH